MNVDDSITVFNEMSPYLLVRVCDIPHDVAKVYE